MKMRWMALIVVVVSAGSYGATVTNADFSDGLTGWYQYSGGPWSWSASGGPDDSAFVRQEGGGQLVSDLFAVEADNGLGYDSSVYCSWGSLGTWGSAQATIEFFDASTNWLGWDWLIYNQQGDGGWTQFTKHFAGLPAGTTQARIWLRHDGGGWYTNFDKVAFGATSLNPPTFSPNGGAFLAATDVTIRCNISDATIRYTLDGTDPTETNGTEITSGDNVTVDHSLILKAKAWKSGISSDIASAGFTIGTLVFNGDLEFPVPGNGWTKLGDYTLTWAASGANHYAQLTDIIGYAWNNGLASDLVAVPSMIGGGGYDFSIDVYCYNSHSETWGMGIEYFKSDYSGNGWGFLIPLSGNTDGWEHRTVHVDSLPADTAYIRIRPSFNSWGSFCFDNVSFVATPLPSVATPTFDSNGGMVALGREVTISCSTPGATIRYTDNGTDPTETIGTVIASGGKFMINQALTLKAKAWASDLNPSTIASASFTIPISYNRPHQIPYGTATVNGDLSDWAGADWAPLDQINKDNPYDIAEAYYSARWTPHKVYLAVKVRDTDHFFTNSYVNWDARDSIETYIHVIGSTGSDNYSSDQAAAQQYEAGIMANNHTAVWTNFGPGWSAAGAGYEAAGREGTGAEAQWLFYEVAMTPYQHYDHSGQNVVPATLHGRDVLGLDVQVTGHDNASYTGFKAEMPGLVNMWNDCTLIGIHALGDAPPTYTISGTVHLGGFIGDVATVSVTVRVTQGSTLISENTIPLDSSSMFTVSGLVAGSYNVRVSAPGWLAVTQEIEVSGDTDATFNLTGGDADGDSQVTFVDFAILQNSYGESGMMASDGDFNGDGQVTFEDFAILQNNYGQSGDPMSSAAATSALASGVCGGLGIMLVSALALAFLGLGARGEN